MPIFKTLDSMLKGNSVFEKLTPVEENPKFASKEEVQNIFRSINSKIKRRLGEKEYQKLEQYVSKNKSNHNLKYLVGYLLVEVIEENLPLIRRTSDDVRCEIMVGYKLSVKLYKTLKEYKYDAEEALIDIWDEMD